MIDMDSVWNASLDQLKLGYVETDEEFTCLCCGERFEKGIIYPEDGLFYEAGKYTRRHIEKAHQSVFEHLIRLDKGATGLSELQRNLLALFYQGKSDAEVQKELAIGSTSTIRNHRYLLKEKERQAKLFLAIMELLRARDKQPSAQPSPATAPAARTADEREKVLKKYFPFGTDGPLKSFAMQQKQKLIILDEIAQRFHIGRRYTEKEINAVLEPIFEDHVTLRRYLVDFGFLNREPDGSRYWRTGSESKQEERSMDRKEMKRLARETKTEAGIYLIKNNRNGKSFIGSTRNLKTINGQQFQLEMGSHLNKRLQQEWNEFGNEAFTIEVLEIVEQPETGYFDATDALNKLKAKWLDQLQPFGEQGYHTSRDEE